MCPYRLLETKRKRKKKMNLFGKAKAAPQTTPKDGVMRVKETLDMLEKREKHLQSKIDKELKIAKENAQKNKKAALMALKRKKLYEAEVEKMMNTRMNLEAQVIQIENASVNFEVLQAMKQGASALKNIHGSVNIERVEDTVDEIQEQMDLANEISNVIGQPMGNTIDDDELLAELEELEQEELDSKLLTVEPELPSAPTNFINPPAKAKLRTEEDELADLKAEMAMSS